MEQFIVRNLEDDVRDKLRDLARRDGRSMEDMVRDILRDAVINRKQPDEGLGTRRAKRFAKHKLDRDLPEPPRQRLDAQPARSLLEMRPCLRATSSTLSTRRCPVVNPWNYDPGT